MSYKCLPAAIALLSLQLVAIGKALVKIRAFEIAPVMVTATVTATATATVIATVTVTVIATTLLVGTMEYTL
jgi:hypothetical protein